MPEKKFNELKFSIFSLERVCKKFLKLACDEKLPFKKMKEVTDILYQVYHSDKKVSICLVGDSETNKTRFIHSLFGNFYQHFLKTSYGAEYGTLLTYKTKNGD